VSTTVVLLSFLQAIKNNEKAHNLKKIRQLQGLNQEDLAKAIGKTRSLISHLERTGNINKYTLQEIADALQIDVESIEKFGSDSLGNIIKDKNSNKLQLEKLKETIVRQKDEIAELKETVKQQWKTIHELTRK